MKKAYADWQKEQNFTILATLKFVGRNEVSDRILAQQIRLFCNKLDRKVKGRFAVKKGNRLQKFFLCLNDTKCSIF